MEESGNKIWGKITGDKSSPLRVTGELFLLFFILYNPDGLSFEVLFDCGWEFTCSFDSPLMGWGSSHKLS